MLLLLSLSFSFFPSLSRSPQVSLTLDKLAFSLSLSLFFRSNQHFPTHFFSLSAIMILFPLLSHCFLSCVQGPLIHFLFFFPFSLFPFFSFVDASTGYISFLPSFTNIAQMSTFLSLLCPDIPHSPLLSPLRIRVNLAKHVARYSAF